MVDIYSINLCFFLDRTETCEQWLSGDRRGVPTFTPGVEQHVQVSGGVPLGSLHAGARYDGHVHTKLSHDGVGRRRDAQSHSYTLTLHNPTRPRAPETGIEGYRHQGAPAGWRLFTWRRRRVRDEERIQGDENPEMDCQKNI